MREATLLWTILLMTACDGKGRAQEGQCSEAEHEMFAACLEIGCSAAYEQRLRGEDTCAADTSVALTEVDAGGSCGVTVAGSCFVVCVCPEDSRSEPSDNQGGAPDEAVVEPDDGPDAGVWIPSQDIVDADGDGYESPEDCDDWRTAINPAATDIVGDDIDQNCDGIDGTDKDRDGFASLASGGEDCDDDDPSVNPAAAEEDTGGNADENCGGE
jgi:hypothetical protein